MKNYLFLTFFLSIFYCVAQNIPSDIPWDYITLRDELKLYTSADDGNIKMAGSPFINKEFLPGKIYVDGKQYQEVYLRFNVLKSVMEIKVKPSDSEIFILPRIKNYTFTQENKTFFLEDIITEDGEVLSGFWMNFYQDPTVRFVGKPVTKTIAAKAAQTGYEKAQPAKVETYVHYYIGLDGKPLKRIQLREKDLRKIFNSEKMKEYFSNNRVQEIEDVVEMLEFYNNQV